MAAITDKVLRRFMLRPDLEDLWILTVLTEMGTKTALTEFDVLHDDVPSCRC